jgi:hypothetical protein
MTIGVDKQFALTALAAAARKPAVLHFGSVVR